MTLISSVLIISFILEGIISNMIGIRSDFFLPLFSVVSLIIVYPYFNHENASFLKFCFVLGLFYDLVYTDTLILNACVFPIIGLLISFLNSRLSNHMISLIFTISFIVLIYRVLNYGILVIVGFFPFSWDVLMTSITSSLLLNIIYGEILYFSTNYFGLKYNFKKID